MGRLASLQQPEGEARPSGGRGGEEAEAPLRPPGGALQWGFARLGKLQGVLPPRPDLEGPNWGLEKPWYFAAFELAARPHPENVTVMFK